LKSNNQATKTNKQTSL